MEFLHYLFLFLGENRTTIMTSAFWILLIFLYWIIYYILPKIDKKIKSKEKDIEEQRKMNYAIQNEYNEAKEKEKETISGAREHYKNLLIENKILKNEIEELKKTILVLKNIEKEKVEKKKNYGMRMQELKQKGKEYEEFVAGYFKLEGYDIYLNGIKKGVKDKGIDIICKKDNELILIQCKNWNANTKYKINHEKLKAFVGACTEYVNEHKLFDRNIKLKFITSNYILDESAKKFLEESKTLQYEILKF